MPLRTTNLQFNRSNRLLRSTPRGFRQGAFGDVVPLSGRREQGGGANFQTPQAFAPSIPSLSTPGFLDSPSAPGIPGAGIGPGLGQLPPQGALQLSGGGFSDITNRFDQLQGTLLGQLEGFGDAERNRINREFRDVGNTAQARLAARGLGSSSGTLTAAVGTEEARQQAVGQLNDRLAALRLGIIGDVGQSRLGFETGTFNRLLDQSGRRELSNISNQNALQRLLLQQQLAQQGQIFNSFVDPQLFQPVADPIRDPRFFG